MSIVGAPSALAFIADDLPELLRVLAASDVRELEIQEGDTRVRLHRMAPSSDGTRAVSPPPHQDPAFQPPTTALVRATHVGTFYRAGQPGTPPLVTEDSQVDDRTIIGIIEALHVLTDVEAGCRGTVTAVLATDGQPVEYNQPLLEVRLGE